ncbi:predicted protein, partial [Postia placenta Mad-698-R]
FTKEKFVLRDIGKFKNVKMLPDRYIRIFKIKQIVCIEYQDLSEDNEREMFQRVQLGMALTPAEKLQAIHSSTSAFVRELVSDFVTDGLATTLDWDLTRGGDFRVLTHAVYNMEKWPNLGTVPGVSTLQKLLTRDEEIPSTFRRAARQTLDILLRISRDPSLHAVAFELPDVKKVAPVEVISAITLVHAHKRTLTLAQLADGIAAMRRAEPWNCKEV